MMNILTDKAAQWHARLRSGSASQMDAVRFKAWLAAHPEHQREYEEIAGLWVDLAALADSPEVVRELAAHEAAASPQARAARGRSRLIAGGRTAARVNRPTTRRLALAACAAAVALIGVTMLHRALPVENGVYRTSVGEQRVLSLEDGSSITLNTATALRLRYSSTQRAVELLNGQANFEVAKDASRPFVVSVAGGEIRALGTVFDVYKAGDRVIVSLIEGAVEVRPALKELSAGATPSASAAVSAETPPRSDALRLAAGEQLSYAESSGIVFRKG